LIVFHEVQSELGSRNSQNRPQTAADTLFNRKSEAARKVEYAKEIKAERAQSELKQSRPTHNPAIPQGNDARVGERRSTFETLKTSAILHTNIDAYFDQHHKEKTCISCLDCIKPKDRPVSYKYPRGMQSRNEETYANNKHASRYETKQFRIE
jgi:hypothetical protein